MNRRTLLRSTLLLSLAASPAVARRAGASVAPRRIVIVDAACPASVEFAAFFVAPGVHKRPLRPNMLADWHEVLLPLLRERPTELVGLTDPASADIVALLARDAGLRRVALRIHDTADGRLRHCSDDAEAPGYAHWLVQAAVRMGGDASAWRSGDAVVTARPSLAAWRLALPAA